MKLFGGNSKKQYENIISKQESELNAFAKQVSELENVISKKEKEYLLTINELKENLKKKEEELSSEKNKTNKVDEEYILLNSKNFKLFPGRYRGGIDIPYGEYNLKILSGYGLVETNKPDDVYFWMSSDSKTREKYNYSEQYNGLIIGEKTILKISNNAEIEFSLRNEYDFQNEIDSVRIDYENKKRELEEEYIERYSNYCKNYNSIKTEIEIVKDELKILNNTTIEKYYVFSDYCDVTSQECKNDLILLRTDEKNLRSNEEDISILTKKINQKITERSIRQILRCFNSECENIMRTIGTKNIDIVRNKIQKSYESLNKLYSYDGVNLSKNILELKLKQATLMYTYELKYRQEKDIQQAIKEQMMEEAKAEREIQEQKKKIEKDLQQHLGEVNRLMKYLQKSQIDAERQLYMDKIKELEDKIKVLESDKETILEREANARAGFVYIISNIGSFGEDIYKIGMTRRLEPMDRVKELSSASVPFEFDVHAMIFSSDAPELETLLHQHFSDRAVNKINPRKEFYHVSIDEIEHIVKENYNDTVQFTKIPLATEYRQSLEFQ